MSKSIFNPEDQNLDLSSKIVVGLERISEVFKSLLWDKAKLVGLSPIQIQTLIFIAYHKAELCNVSHLAKEFNVTKPTISDVIKVLDKKKLIVKEHSSTDSRRYTIKLSNLGRLIVENTNDFAAPLESIVRSLPEYELEGVYKALSTLIYKLNKNEVLKVQRTCFGCVFYTKSETSHYCNLLNKELFSREIRLDCPDFKEKN